MKPTDFAILMFCCLFWGTNFVVSAWALGHSPVPPFFLAFVRSCFVLAVMWPFLLRQRPEGWRVLLLVCILVAPVHLGFLYSGLQTAPASASSIVSQTIIPITTVLSLVFLKEQVGWVRGLAIIGALIGTIIMVYDPATIGFDLGLIWIICAYISLGVGSVLMKYVGDVDWRQYVVWMALMMFLLSGPTTLIFEDNHARIWAEAKWPLLIAAGYAAVFVTLFSHGQYFNLIRKYDVTQIVPLTLMTTFFATVLGVLFLNETLHLRYYIGAALILPCVWIIAKRQKTVPIVED